MNPSIKKITLMGAFTALGVALGYAFITIPNVEMVSATIFIAGFLLGIKEGVLIGIFTEALYSALNPYGLAAPPLFIAQIVSMGFTGLLGGLMGSSQNRSGAFWVVKIGTMGLVSTFVFAVLTTLSFALFIEFSKTTLIGSFIYGMGFYIVHIVSNTVIFLTLVPLILKYLSKAEWMVSSSREACV